MGSQILGVGSLLVWSMLIWNLGNFGSAVCDACQFCLFLVSWVALIRYICGGGVCPKWNLRVEYHCLVRGGYYWVLGWGILLIGPKRYMYLRFWGCDMWTRLKLILLLGVISCVRVLRDFQNVFWLGFMVTSWYGERLWRVVVKFFALLVLFWELGLCGITFEFLGRLMRPGRR